MKTIILIAGILCSFAGYSVTPLERMGGMVVQPGSQKGKIVILRNFEYILPAFVFPALLFFAIFFFPILA